MRLFTKIVLSLAALPLLLTGCSDRGSSPAQTVNVFMYSEYIGDDLVEQFEQETGLTVRIDVYENTEEMLAKLKQAGGEKLYDVLVASNEAVPGLIKLGLVQPLDHAAIPNLSHISDEFNDPAYDRGMKHSAPYQWGTVGLMFRKDKLANPQDISWALLFEADQQPGRFVMMDSMRDTLGAALKYRGESMNSVDPQKVKAAGELVLAAKRSSKCLGFEGGVGGVNKIKTGEADLAMVYNGDAIREGRDNPNIGYAVPKEGGDIWVDVMLVLGKAPNAGGAHRFINFILDPQNGAKLSNYNRYATPNKDSLPLIRAEDRANPAIYPPAEVMKTLELLHTLGNDIRVYDEVWTSVKSR
ncbi:MAG: spermidine/putrescine ABC transporter substrate-binding protein [Phycisphaeraceae bacterium]